MSDLAAELDGIDLGDLRLNRRARRVLAALGEKPTLSIPAACGGWCETRAAYRLFDHDAVTAEAVLAPHIACTIKRMATHPRVLCIEDTSEIDYTGKPSMQGLGPLNRETRQGLYLHPMLAVTPERLSLGLLNVHRWGREPGSLGQDKDPNRPLEEKESVRWVDGYRQVDELAQQLPDTRLTYVADREADIYDLFVEAPCPEAAADWLVRGQHDRVIAKGKTLRQQLDAAPVLTETTFERPASHGTKSRTVHQQIRTVRVTLPPPRRPDRTLADVEVTAILASEPHPPEGEAPVEWLLLTNLPANTPEQALEKLQWYLCRWQIEVYFRILKSGCRIEKLQLETRQRLAPALAFYMILAWRVLFLTMLGRACPEMWSSIPPSGKPSISSPSANRPPRRRLPSIAWCAWSPASAASSTASPMASQALRPYGSDYSALPTSSSPWMPNAASGRGDMGNSQTRARSAGYCSASPRRRIRGMNCWGTKAVWTC